MTRLRAVRPAELTPAARIDAAKRALVQAIDDLVEARLAMGAAAADWVDQDSSPLGKRRHLELVREGVLRGVKDGRKVLVRRADLDAYLEAHPRNPSEVVDEEEDVDAMVRAITGGAKR